MPSHSKKTLILIASDYDSVGNGRQIEMAVVAILAAGYRVCVVLVSSGRGLAVRLKRLGAVVYMSQEAGGISFIISGAASYGMSSLRW